MRWVVVRVFAHGTTGIWGNTHPDSLGYGEVLRRFDLPNGNE